MSQKTRSKSVPSNLSADHAKIAEAILTVDFLPAIVAYVIRMGIGVEGGSVRCAIDLFSGAVVHLFSARSDSKPGRARLVPNLDRLHVEIDSRFDAFHAILSLVNDAFLSFVYGASNNASGKSAARERLGITGNAKDGYVPSNELSTWIMSTIAAAQPYPVQYQKNVEDSKGSSTLRLDATTNANVKQTVRISVNRKNLAKGIALWDSEEANEAAAFFSGLGCKLEMIAKNEAGENVIVRTVEAIKVVRVEQPVEKPVTMPVTRSKVTRSETRAAA